MQARTIIIVFVVVAVFVVVIFTAFFNTPQIRCLTLMFRILLASITEVLLSNKEEMQRTTTLMSSDKSATPCLNLETPIRNKTNAWRAASNTRTMWDREERGGTGCVREFVAIMPCAASTIVDDLRRAPLLLKGHRPREWIKTSWIIHNHVRCASDGIQSR